MLYIYIYYTIYIYIYIKNVLLQLTVDGSKLTNWS